jgi:hypothetical protein
MLALAVWTVGAIVAVFVRQKGVNTEFAEQTQRSQRRADRKEEPRPGCRRGFSD